MENFRIRHIGATIVVLSSAIYGLFRLNMLIDSYSVIHLVAFACEIGALALISTEAILLASRTKAKARKQDERVLIESAKQVLYSSSQSETTTSQISGETLTKVDQKTQVVNSFSSEPVDVCVFAEDASYDELRRCFLSLKQARDIENIYVVASDASDSTRELISEFSFSLVESTSDMNATTKNVLVCRGKDIIYPDANEIAKTYDFDGSAFLELRSVFSDENALGDNGLVQIQDKRQQVRESLATRGLATWSTGPAIVQFDAAKEFKNITAASDFFRLLEQNGIHGEITQEIVSEEISYEATIAEVDWRSDDFNYTSRAVRNSYKTSKLLGFMIKVWAALVSTSYLRRITAISLALLFVLVPARFEFVSYNYLLSLAGVVAAISIGGYLAGDKRDLVTRIREFYFDLEAVVYNIYKGFLPSETKGTEKSIVRKLPSVSFLLVTADMILVYRVFRQYNNADETLVSNLLKIMSLLGGFLLVVSLLVGLGMVVVRQSRTAQRREISRGANLKGEPVSMIDLSPGGAGCISVMKFEEGDTVKFESSFPIGDSSKKFTCEAKIKSCVQWGDSYRIGIAFENVSRAELDTLETYCSVVYPHAQARDPEVSEKVSKVNVNTRAEKRFISYAATYITLAAVIFSNITTWS